MKLLLVADIIDQTLLEQTKSCRNLVDAIISCGDLPPEYLTTLRNLYDAPLYYVLGNHDLRYNESPPIGCTPLNRRLIHLGSHRIVGFSGSRWYNGQVNQYTEKEMTRFVKRMRFLFWRKGWPDIVITHSPPRFLGDEEDIPHRGFRVFRWLIDICQPKYFLHGHIHRSFLHDRERFCLHGKTTIVNCFGSYVLEI